MKATKKRGQKRKAAESFPEEEENQDLPEREQNTGSPEELNPDGHEAMRTAGEAELSQEEDRPGMPSKRVRLEADFDSDPLPGPSGIAESERDAPDTCTRHHSLTSSDSSSSEVEEDEDEDEDDSDFYNFFLNVNFHDEDNSINIDADEDDEALPEPAAHPHALPVSAEFSAKYEVLWDELLGRGNNTWVYAGFRRIDGQQVAIKFVHVSEDDRDRKRYDVPGVPSSVFTEIGMMLEMQLEPPLCPNVVVMLDWFEGYPGYIVVMERLAEPWVSFDQFVLENHGVINERVYRDLLHQVLKTFVYLSNSRIEHEEIRANHIMVNKETLELKVIGFGNSQRIGMENIEGHQICGAYHESLTYQRSTCIMYTEHLRLLWRDLERVKTSTFSREYKDFFKMSRNYLATGRVLENYLKHPWITSDEWTYNQY